MSFATRLVIGTVLILLLAVLVLVTAAERSLRGDLEAAAGRALEREARIVREVLPQDSLRWQAVVERLARENAIRITLIDSTGRVRADSDVPTDSVAALTNHAERPEVQAAFAGRRGRDVRASATTGRRTVYVAIPGDPGVIRVATSPTPVNEIVSRARAAMLRAALLALALGTAVAFIAGRSIARPLTAIGGAARAIAAGAAPRFPRSGIPEIDTVIQALRLMHQQLGDRFEELRREQAESAALIESMVEGVLATDSRGRIITANPAARRLLGYGNTEPLPDLPELFRVKAARELVGQVLAGASVHGRHLEMDGRVFLLSGRPLPAGGAVLVIHDLTELRRLEVVRRDFVANVSHELKTPLTSISGYAETLLGEELEAATTRRFLETILSNARRMQRLVDDLLDLSRIESGRWQPEREPVEVEPVVREIWAGLADRAASRQVELEIEVHPETAVLRVDPDAFQQIISNLLDNAVRFTPIGGRITCRSRPEAGGIAVSVSDNGPGIGRDHLPRIFERFYRADPARSREEGGTGLGLAIVKHLVEAHGGRVTAESQLGFGTTVSCWFPPA